MTRARKPSSKSARPAAKSAGSKGAGSKGAGSKSAEGKGAAQPRTTSPSGTPRPTGNRSKTDGKLHIRPGSERKAKTDSRPLTASRRKADQAEEQRAAEAAETETGTLSSRSGAGRTAARSGTAGRSGTTSGRPTASGGRSTARKPNPPRLRGPQLDSPPPTTTFRDRDGKPHTFPDSALKRIAAKILTDKNKKWRYRPFGFPIFSPNGNEQEMHFDFYIYDNMDSVARLILLMPRESRETWDKVGRFKQQYPMYHYELWTPDALAKILAPRGGLGW
jgi:hypothetical protein